MSAVHLVLNRDPLHFIERDLIARSVIELRRPRRFVRRDHGSIFKRAAVLQIRRYPGRPKRVAARGGGEPGRECPTFHHPEDVRTRHWILRDLPPGIDAPEERRLLVVTDARSIEIRVEVCFGVVMAGDLVPLAALFVEPHPTSACRSRNSHRRAC